MKRVKVIIAENWGRLNLDPHQLEELHALDPRLDVVYLSYKRKEELRDALGDAEVLYAMSAGFDPAWAPRLRWIQLYTAGFDHLLTAPITRTGVTITTTSGIHGYPMSEFVFGLIFSITRQLPKIFQIQRERRWEKDVWLDVIGTEAREKTIGILGYGNIGREIGRVARCLGMKVLGLKRSAPRETSPADGVIDRLFDSAGLHEMLSLSDFVVITLPLTPTTEKMIDEAALRAMRPGAWLINVARGAIIDEPALLRALREGWIAGAALDTFVREPLPPESEFYDLPNVIITPHVAAGTDRYEERALGVFKENLRRYLAGEPLINVVDVGRGY